MFKVWARQGKVCKGIHQGLACKKLHDGFYNDRGVAVLKGGGGWYINKTQATVLLNINL